MNWIGLALKSCSHVLSCVLRVYIIAFLLTFLNEIHISASRNLNLMSTTQPIPAHHLKQWQGGCNRDCDQDPLFYCGKEDKWCHECGMFCESNHQSAKCKDECPARYDALNPTLPPTPPPANQTSPSTPTPTNSTGSFGQPTNTTSPGNIPSPNSGKSSTEFDYRWLYGLLCLAFAIVCVFLYLRKYHPRGCIQKTPDALPTPCTEDHRRAPLYYQPNNGHVQVTAQREAVEPLMQQRQPMQPSSADEQPMMTLVTMDRQGSPSSSDVRVLVTGADDSFIFGDQSTTVDQEGVV